jgi:ureidoacrylate peracid hydrolase
MAYNTLDPQKTAVLFFDMLNAYFRGTSEANQRKMEPIVAAAATVRDEAAKRGIPCFFAKADHRPDGLDSAHLLSDTDYSLTPWEDPNQGFTTAYRTVPGSDWRTEVIEELHPEPGDYMITKHRWNAFHQTHLELSLRSRGIDTIVICGGATHIGIASTAYAARDLDFNLVIVRDACSGLEDNVKQFMERVFPIFSRIRNAHEVVAMMETGASDAAS